MMGDAGILAAASSALTALLYWVGSKLRASITRTTTEAKKTIDVSEMREELDKLNEFVAALKAERAERTEAERRASREALEAKVEALERALELDVASAKSGVRTQPMRIGK